jgi:hypothetical protein
MGPFPAAAQTAPAPAATPRAHAAARGPRKPASSEFDVVDWLSLTPSTNSLIRAPNQAAGVDLTAREDESYVTVYARKKRPDAGPRIDPGYAPSESDSAVPDYDHVRYLPPTHCANGAYNTVAGQSANTNDLMGFLGSGAGC